ncbi:MAG TPA: TetR/AcrR family transcriptional regulator [Acidimicrobiales bacterium]|jgi:AcrR family transcriptional regulator
MVNSVALGTSRPAGQRTRERILDATIECLARLGYVGTTTLAVQSYAGVTRGRLLHHFPSRDELLVAAVAHLADARFGIAAAQLRAAAGTQDGIDAAIEAMWNSFQGPLFAAATELWIAARTNPDLCAILMPAELELGARLRAGWALVFGPASESHRFPDVYDLLLTNMRGVALTSQFDGAERRAPAHLVDWKRLAHDALAGSADGGQHDEAARISRSLGRAGAGA